MKIDSISLLAMTPVKAPLKKIEAELSLQGYTLGYHPEKNLTLEEALIGRIPNRFALKYGEIDDLCVSVKVQRGGEVFTTRNVPRSSTGPDFKKIFAVGDYGKILEATLKIVPLPEKKGVHRFRIKREKRDSFSKGLWASGIRPARVESTPSGFVVYLEGPTDIVEAETKGLKKIFHAVS